jgi:hypothetical protein
VAIATDEENRLRVYRRDQGGPPLQTFDLASHLGLERHSPETDIEGAARVGDCVYWIGSHSRNQDGRFRPNRCRFFATAFEVSGDDAKMRFLGVAYQNLVNDLAHAPELKRFDFDRASRLAPKQPGALNIEGLCATPDNQLLIAFRNPVPNGRALLVPLTNPEQIVMNGQPAKFGEPIHDFEIGAWVARYDDSLHVTAPDPRVFAWTPNERAGRLWPAWAISSCG